MLHIPPTNSLLLTAKQEPNKKASLLTKISKNFLEKKLRRKGQQAEKDRKGNRTRQKNKRGDSKVESNDSPEIPDRGKPSDIPGLPSGAFRRRIIVLLGISDGFWVKLRAVEMPPAFSHLAIEMVCQGDPFLTRWAKRTIRVPSRGRWRL